MKSFVRSFLLGAVAFAPFVGFSEGEHVSQTTNNEYDYVIVGAGTSGCLIAEALTKLDKNGNCLNSVLVIEAGENLTDDPAVYGSNNFFGAGPIIFNSKYSKTYLGNSGGFELSEGHMWGGGSSHNGVQSYRGTPALYGKWEAATNDSRWSYNNLLTTVFLKLENYTPNGTTANLEQRGSKGPLFISQEPPLSGDAFMQAVAKGTNSPLPKDLNDPTEGVIGVGANQDWVTPPFLGPTSVRCSSASAFITGIAGEGVPPIVDSNGKGLNGRKLTIISNATVSRVIFEKNVATSVEYIINNTTGSSVNYAFASKKIILCAGAIQDPVILQRSGIGDPTLLESLGIPVVVANSNVGTNLQDHYGPIGVIGGVTTGVNIPSIGNAFIDYSPYLSPGVRRGQVLIINAVALPAQIAGTLGITSGISLFGGTITPSSKGTVQIVSADPFFDPIINYPFFSDGTYSEEGSDAYEAVSFYKILQTIATEAGGTVLYPPAADYAAGDAALFNDVQLTNDVAYHYSCTCPMGTSIANGAVLDSTLNVLGVSNLMVASCASAPVIEDGNTAYQAFVIGAQAALILGAEF